MKKTKMMIEDIESFTGYTLTCDTYDQETHTTTSHVLEGFNDLFKSEIIRKYNNRYFYYIGSQPTTTPTSAFLTAWNEFKTMNQENINRVFDALVWSKYNATENVFESKTTHNTYGDIDTTIDNGKTKTETATGERTDSTSIGSRSDSQTQGAQHSDSANYETTMENATTTGYKPTSKGENNVDSVTNTATTGAQSNSTTYGAQTNSTTTEQLTDSTQNVKHDDDIYHENRHGNVGTIDSGTLISKEMLLRRTNFIEWVVSVFINKYTYYFDEGL